MERSFLTEALAAGLASADLPAVAAAFEAQGLSHVAERVRAGTVESLAQAWKALDLVALRMKKLETAQPAACSVGLLESETAVPCRFSDVRREKDPIRFGLAVGIYCAQASLEELKLTRDRLWSDSLAAPFVVAAVRPELASALATDITNPIAGKTAIALGQAKRLLTAPPPICHWAEEASVTGAARQAWIGTREARRALYAETIKTALHGATVAERAWAVLELGHTRDPLFADVLRAADVPEAQVALALIGDDSRLETWLADPKKFARPLAHLREARGLAELVRMNHPALAEAGEDAIDAALDARASVKRWKKEAVEERIRRRRLD